MKREQPSWPAQSPDELTLNLDHGRLNKIEEKITNHDVIIGGKN